MNPGRVILSVALALLACGRGGDRTGDPPAADPPTTEPPAVTPPPKEPSAPPPQVDPGAELPLRSPAAVWVRPSFFRAIPGGLAADRDGNALFLWQRPTDAAVVLERIDRAGSGEAVQQWPVGGFVSDVLRDVPGLHVGPSGTVYVGVTGQSDAWFFGFPEDTLVDLGAGAVTGAQLVELREDGSYVRTVLRCCGFEDTAWVEDVNGDGDVLVAAGNSGNPTVTLVRADGRQVELWRAGAFGTRGPTTGCSSPRFTPDGGVVCGGLAVVKLDLEGRIVWTRAVERGGAAASVPLVGVTARGTVVAAGFRSWDEPNAGFLAALEPDGSVRFVADVAGLPRALAVKPGGRAAMLLGDVEDRHASTVVYADLAGKLLWRARVPDARHVAFAGDRIVVAGALAEGTHDLGLGPITAAPGTADVYVAAFEP